MQFDEAKRISAMSKSGVDVGVQYCRSSNKRTRGDFGCRYAKSKLGRSVRWRSTQLASFGRLEQPTGAGTPCAVAVVAEG